MKLHDKEPAAAPDADDLWALIPWYVNGSLPDDQAAAVAAFAQTTPGFAAEIGRQRVLAKKVTTTDPFDAPLARSWDSLRAQIDADAGARIAPRQWFAGLNGGVAALIGAVAVACVVVAVQVVPSQPEGFVTLTSTAPDSLPLIKFQPVPGLDPSTLAELISPLGLTDLSGPSDAGIFTAALPKDADPLAVADTLMALPDILFAAPENE